MSVQLGINPLTWTNDDLPQLGSETPLETCLSEGKLAGFSGFELGNKFPRQPEVLGPILKKHDLQLVSGWYSLELLTRTVDEEIASIQAHLNLLKSLNAKVMVACEVTHCIHGDLNKPVHLRIPFPKEQWKEYGEKLNKLAQYTLSQGVQIAYHHHMGTVIQSEAEIDQLMNHTGSEVGLLLDTGHLTFASGDPLTVAKRWAKRINHVHCKDIRKEVLTDSSNRKLSFLNSVLNGVFTVPGDGCIDYRAIFDILKFANYEGWFIVEAEQDPSIAHPLTYAKLGYNNLYQFSIDAGFTIKQ